MWGYESISKALFSCEQPVLVERIFRPFKAFDYEGVYKKYSSHFEGVITRGRLYKGVIDETLQYFLTKIKFKTEFLGPFCNSLKCIGFKEPLRTRRSF